MNKIRVVLLLTLLSVFGISEAQLVMDDIIIEPYWGISSGRERLRRIAYRVVDSEDVARIEGLGPFGIRGQYMVSEDFGIGLDINYTELSLTYVTDRDSSTTYTDKIQRNVLRVMVRTSWVFFSTVHTQLSWDNSIGYRNANWIFTSDRMEEDFKAALPFGVWPLALRSALTFRYLFIPNFGAFAELGVSGGSFINVGLSGRF